MEHIIFSHIISDLEEFKILSDIQHGFRKYHLCETQLLITLEDLTSNLDHGKQSDITLLDFAKSSDTLPHQRLLLKLRHYGIQSTINKWIQAGLCYREQSVLVEGEKSAPVSLRLWKCRSPIQHKNQISVRWWSLPLEEAESQN